jgi:hypothetical protein
LTGIADQTTSRSSAEIYTVLLKLLHHFPMKPHYPFFSHRSHQPKQSVDVEAVLTRLSSDRSWLGPSEPMFAELDEIASPSQKDLPFHSNLAHHK